MTVETRFTADAYGEGYWESGQGSNYIAYGDDPGWSRVLQVMSHFRPTRGRLIEAACAKGYFVMHAVEHGWDARGFDLSEYAVSKAPFVARDRVRVHDAIDPWPYPAESADIVCAWEFFEHIHDENIPIVLVRMKEALKPGGELWLKTGIIIPSDHPYAGQEDHDHTHVAVHDREWWENLFTAAKLTKVPEAEALLDKVFADRDWQGRFFVWRKPEC